MHDDEIHEEANLFAKAVRNFLLFLLIMGCVIATLSLSSCVRAKTTTSHTRDTIYIVIHDTTKITIHDTLAVEKVHHKIDTIFSEIEKDCPQEKAKLNVFKKEIKDECTIESLTGGLISIYFPKLKQTITIKFFGNKGVAVEDGRQEIITDKTEKKTIVKLSLFQQMLNTWFMWLPPWAFITLLFLLRLKK